MTGLRLVLHQVRYDLKAFFRNPAALFFTAVLPVIFLVVFVGIFGNETLDNRPDVRLSTYYVPGILALAVISATFVNLAISLTVLREDGVLKRLRGTPLPSGVFIAARILQSFVLSAILVVVLGSIGRLLYDVDLPGRTMPQFLLTLLVGAAAFSCLGLAISGFIPSEEAGPAMTNAIVLPLYFISGTFFPVDDAPSWMRQIAGVFPIRHLSEALFDTFTGGSIDGSDLVNIGIWGIGGLVVALRTFRWTPRSH